MMLDAKTPKTPQVIHKNIGLTENNNIPRLGPHTKASDQTMLYVPMYNAVLMRMLQCGTQLCHQAQNQVNGEESFPVALQELL